MARRHGVHNMTRVSFPFSAIVGQSQLKSALLLCAVDTSLGGVLIRGDKGSAKSTAARALVDILPHIKRTVGCSYNCDPDMPYAQCEACHHAEHIVQDAPVPFVTLPLGATEDRLIGTLDLERALQGAKRVFQPGLLADAHRGILYIDEVNLLPDHLVDVLLDAAAMGQNSVQREGLSVTHPARFSLIGTMNLEEGDLRPQLLDRFGLMVEVKAPQDKALRSEVVRRRIAFEAAPDLYLVSYELQQAQLRSQVRQAQSLLARVVLADETLDLISHLCCEFEVASLRADIVMHKTARALAALDGRLAVNHDDVRSAAELVLPHRRRRKPFEQPGLDRERLDELINEAAAESRQPQSTAPAGDDHTSVAEAHAELSEPTEIAEQYDTEQPDAQHSTSQQPSSQQPSEQTFSSGMAATSPKISVEADATEHIALGRRSQAGEVTRGRVVRSMPHESPDSLAVGATLRSAALRNASEFKVQRYDLHQNIRAGKTANLILFVVDASGSMAAQQRMETVKGAVLALLTDAYQQRDEVSVIAFRGEQASLLLPPTRSVDLAQNALRELPTGGRTPLPHALQLALEVLEHAATHLAPPLLVVLSDGKANVAVQENGDPWRETLAMAGLFAQQKVPTLVIDTETGYLRLGCANQLAQAMMAEYLTLESLSSENLALTIRARMRQA